MGYSRMSVMPVSFNNHNVLLLPGSHNKKTQSEDKGN